MTQELFRVFPTELFSIKEIRSVKSVFDNALNGVNIGAL